MGSIGLEKPEQGLATPAPVRVEGLRGPWAAARAFLLSDAGVVASLTVAACAVHFGLNGRYGYFRDELYYAACGEHLAWGYVDQAPLVAVIARLTRWLLGDSLAALRFFPALSAGAKILLTGWMVRELGGKRFAQLLAGTAVLFAPIYLTFDNFLSMNAFEPVFWMLGAALAMRAVGRGQPRLWLVFGLVAGLGVLNKHSMAFFVSGLLVGLLLTPARRLFRQPWIWLGALFGFAIVLPNLLWEAQYNWPTLEILRTVERIKNTHISPLMFIFQQGLLTHPLAVPIWVAGLWFLLFTREGRKYRFLGWAYLVVLGEFLILRGKIYYLAPAYPMLLAGGAVWIEQRIREHHWSWLKPATFVPLVAGGLIAAPLALPVLPVEAMVKYSRFWNVKSIKVENQRLGKLPQLFADMFGWRQQVATVARVYHSLPAEERVQCALLAFNYGEAGAIDYFGPAYGLPKAISGHNSYFLWGPRGYSGDVVIAIGFPPERLRTMFGEVELAAVVMNDYAMPEETNLPICICRKPKRPLRQIWPQLKFYG